MQEEKQGRVAIACMNAFAEVLHTPLYVASKSGQVGENREGRGGLIAHTHRPGLPLRADSGLAWEGAAIRKLPTPLLC